MSRSFIIIAALLGATAVALGAFGAHGLESTLEANDRVDTFETAARYHMYGALALVAVAWMAGYLKHRLVIWGGYLIAGGTVIFSGSLYILAMADLGFMGAVAPIGGTALVAGWGCIGWAAWLQTASNSS